LTGRLSRGVLHLLGSISRGILRFLSGLPGASGSLLLRSFGHACHIFDGDEAAGTRAFAFELREVHAQLLGFAAGRVLGGLHHVADNDASSGTRAFDLREIHAQLLGLSPSRLRGVKLYLSPCGSVFCRLGKNLHIVYGDTSIGARAFDLREVYAQLPRVAAGRVRGVDLSLPPDLLRV
jgi:hypothetical protein